MKTPKHPNPMPLTIAAVATMACTGAHAEYRCANPQRLSSAETRACQLARQDMPDALIHFVNRTKPIYGLYLNDYVSSRDVDRWDTVQQEAARAVASASVAANQRARVD